MKSTRSSHASGMCPYEIGEWKAKPRKHDSGYFEEMTRTIFQAGLNWEIIRNKWLNFRKAFAYFSTNKVARFRAKDVKRLLKNEGIVRNERKIKATIHNAQEFLIIKKAYGSFSQYLKSFNGESERILSELQTRFRHMGNSSSSIFLWSVGVKVPFSPTNPQIIGTKQET